MEPLERLAEDVVEQDGLTCRGQHDPAGAERAVRKARGRAQCVQRGQHLQQEPERDVDAGGRIFLAGVLGTRLDQVRQAVAKDEFGDDGQASVIVALDAVEAREALVSEGGALGDAVSERGFEGQKLRAQPEAFAPRARLAVEPQQAAAESVLVPRGGQRGGRIEGWCRHCRAPTDSATAAPDRSMPRPPLFSENRAVSLDTSRHGRDAPRRI
jgi:hypothetical protein